MCVSVYSVLPWVRIGPATVRFLGRRNPVVGAYNFNYKNCPVLGYYAVSRDKSLLKFRDNLSVGPICRPET